MNDFDAGTRFITFCRVGTKKLTRFKSYTTINSINYFSYKAQLILLMSVHLVYNDIVRRWCDKLFFFLSNYTAFYAVVSRKWSSVATMSFSGRVPCLRIRLIGNMTTTRN